MTSCVYSSLIHVKCLPQYFNCNRHASSFAGRQLSKFLEILEEAHITVYIQRHGNKEVTI